MNIVYVDIQSLHRQFRDIAIYSDQYPLELKENLLPGSDVAGEIVALGEDVHGWSVGDRVSSSVMTDYVFGNVSDAIAATALGGPIDGVLTEFKIIPAHVSPP